MPGFPQQDDGKVPWIDDEGGAHLECPWPALEEAVETLTEYGEMRTLGDPAKTGRAPWLTAPYREAMRLCRLLGVSGG